MVRVNHNFKSAINQNLTFQVEQNPDTQFHPRFISPQITETEPFSGSGLGEYEPSIQTDDLKSTTLFMIPD